MLERLDLNARFFFAHVVESQEFAPTGLTLSGMGAAFWGPVLGLLALGIRSRRTRALPTG